MKKFVIAFISFFKNKIKIYFIKVNTMKEAILNSVEKDNKEEMNKYLPEDKKDIKDFYANMDAAIEIQEIPGNF